jgi:hypothetical protein
MGRRSELLMAKFVCDVALDMDGGIFVCKGPVGTVHRIVDSIQPQFDEDYGTGRIPGLVWLVVDEIALL